MGRADRPDHRHLGWNLFLIGLFLTVVQGTREQIARRFLWAALAILIGCLLESYGGLRPFSDSVRAVQELELADRVGFRADLNAAGGLFPACARCCSASACAVSQTPNRQKRCSASMLSRPCVRYQSHAPA